MVVNRLILKELGDKGQGVMLDQMKYKKKRMKMKFRN